MAKQTDRTTLVDGGLSVAAQPWTACQASCARTAGGVAPGLAAGPPPAAVASRRRRAVGLPDRHGVLVLKVKRESAADAAGLARGDLVTGAGGQDVRTIGDLHRALRHARNGTLKLDVVRGVEERAVEVSLSRSS